MAENLTRRDFLRGSALSAAILIMFGPMGLEYLTRLFGVPKTPPEPPRLPIELVPPEEQSLNKYTQRHAIQVEGTDHELVRVLNTDGIANKFIDEAKAGKLIIPPASPAALIEVDFMKHYAGLPAEQKKRYLNTAAAGIVDGIAASRTDANKKLAIIISPGHPTAKPANAESEFNRVNKLRKQKGFAALKAISSDDGTSAWVKGEEITEKDVTHQLAVIVARQIRERNLPWIPVLSSPKPKSVQVLPFRDPTERGDEFLLDFPTTILPLRLQEERLAAEFSKEGLDTLIIDLHLNSTDDPRVSQNGGTVIFPNVGMEAQKNKTIADGLVSGLQQRLRAFDKNYSANVYPNEPPLYWYFATAGNNGDTLADRTVTWIHDQATGNSSSFWTKIAKG